MAKRPSVKEILEAARRGGPATSSAGESAEPAASAAPAAAAPAPAPAPAVPAPAAPLGRPLTLKEKLAAARAGGTAPAPAPAAAAPAPTAEAAPAEAPAAPAVPPPAAPIGRPLTLKEKLAAARGGAAAPAAPSGAAPAAKPAAAQAAPAAVKAARELPPLDAMTDPKDLAEALRQSGEKKAKAATAAAAAKAATAAGATPAKAAAAAKSATKDKHAAPATVPPKPSRAVVLGRAVSRRTALVGTTLFGTWIAVAWTTFAAGCTLFTAMMGRFMFPNVLAEPPSTIKVGLPSNFEPEEVNERFKAEWGFWIVRSTRVNGTDQIYALQSVCTHLGCPPNWLAGEQKFKCPCHGSGFYISGINFEGPAPRPLERFKVTLADDGQMVIDKSQKFQQELGQWADPDSFITA